MGRAITPAIVVLGLAAVAASAQPCAPLPPPVGPVVDVATEAALQSAVQGLTSGTTIRVADGVYDLTNTLRVRNGVADVTIRGASGDRDAVVLRGRGMSNSNYGNVPHVFLIEDANDVTLADMTLRDAWFHNVQIRGEVGPQRVRLYNLHLIDSGEQQIKGSTAGVFGLYADDGEVACSLIEYTDRARSDYTNGVDILAGARWTIRDNLFRNIRAPIGSLAGPTILMWRNCLDTVVERNQFLECDRAIALGLSPPDANSRDGEGTYDHQGGIVRNNMIHRAAGAATGDVGITVNYARDFKLHHNSVVLEGTFPWTIEYRFAVSDGAIAYNLTDGPILPRDGATATLSGNLTNAQPSWFLAPVTGDLHLDPSATAAIDQAAPLAAVADDFDGDARPIGVQADIGADELRSCLLPPTPITSLFAVRSGAHIDFTWSDASTFGYHLWYVLDKATIDRARLGDPLAQGVLDCSPPMPAPTPSCRDSDAIARTAPTLFHYQARAVCGGSEGP